MHSCAHLFRFWLAAAALQFGAVGAQAIEIKGISIGMTRAELQKKYPTWRGFTIAGVRSLNKDSPGHVEYFKGRLDNFHFSFDSDSFLDVLEAVKEKYPNIDCKNSQIKNVWGATFNQVECFLADNVSTLFLSRYGGDLRTSGLTLASVRRLDALEEKNKLKKKDI